MCLPCSRHPCGSVALLAEGVDRNENSNRKANRGRRVALLAEGVDRNKFWGNNTCAYPSSPSSRRAWIEIQNRNFFENRA